MYKTDSKIRDIISNMSLHEKIGQMNQDYFTLERCELLEEKIRNGEIGSLILSNSSTAGNDEQHKTALEIINKLQKCAVENSKSHIPIIFGRDVIHGHNTVLPIPLALAATFNPKLVEKSYRGVAKEASNDGIHWTFSPMVDISRDPRWGRCIEGAGEDPYLASQMAIATVKGFQGDDLTQNGNIAACVKHYLGYGQSEGGRDYSNTEISEYSIRNCFLTPFKAAVDAGVRTVMTAFNGLNADAILSNKYWITDVLKNELGFDGFTISDWDAVGQLIEQGLAKDKKDAAELSLNAGLDMDMVSNSFVSNLEQLVEEGVIAEELINDAVYRILLVKSQLGLFENPYTEIDSINTEENEQWARKCSDEAIVLLKNKNKILPLSKETKALFAGPMLEEKTALRGSWALDADESRFLSIREALEQKNVSAQFPQSPYLADACQVYVHFNDVIVAVLGESHQLSGESNSLAEIELPYEQLEWIKKLHRHGLPIVGVICSGRPLALEEAEPYLDAIVYAWQGGTCAAQSIVSVLYGEVNPSGKLPMSFPRRTGQIPIYYNHLRGPRHANGYYGIKPEWVHQPYHDCLPTPMYRFGYGLSYTKFEYSNISSEKPVISIEELKNGKKLKISATVKNVGDYDGKITTQCYIRDEISSMIRPNRELKAFSKDLLHKDEEKVIVFDVGFDELGFYNRENEFVVDKGKFTIYIGEDCYADMRLEIEII